VEQGRQCTRIEARVRKHATHPCPSKADDEVVHVGRTVLVLEEIEAGRLPLFPVCNGELRSETGSLQLQEVLQQAFDKGRNHEKVAQPTYVTAAATGPTSEALMLSQYSSNSPPC